MSFWIPGAFVALFLGVNYVCMENSPADAGFVGFRDG